MEEKYVPIFKKPEHVCFWCGRETLTDEMLDECVSDFGRYYLRCPNCGPDIDRDENLFIIEAVKFPVLIDQPMYDGRYPTGPWCAVHRDKAVAARIKLVTEGAIEVSESDEEMLVSPAAYSLITGQPASYDF